MNSKNLIGCLTWIMLAGPSVSWGEAGPVLRQTPNPASFTDMHLGLFASYTCVGKPHEWGWTEWADGTLAKSLDELADNLDVEDFAATAAAMRAQDVIFTTWLRCQTITEEWWARRATVQWQPEQAYVTKGAQDWPAEGQPLNGLSYCATESPDGKKTFVHVFLPPKERGFQLPVPADGRRFSSARLLDTGRKLSLLQTDAGVRLTLDPADRWDDVDTIIVME